MTEAFIKKNLFSNIKGDLFGGLTAGIIALPLSLAFGVSSGLGAAAGLYGAIIVGLIASLFGGTRTQISGPTGPMTVVLASIVASYPNNFNFVFLTIVLAGIFQILFGLSKIGTLIKYIPYPVISGFMSGIGVIIIILQLNPLLGLTAQGGTVKSLQQLFTSFDLYSASAFLLGLLTLGILFLTPRKIAKIIPPVLIALIAVTVLSVILNIGGQTIGNIPNTLPRFIISPFSFADILKIIPFAITLAILGSVDSLLTSLVADSLTKEAHKPNKELIGQGLGNLVSGLFGGIAGAGATMRTVVNIKSGGKTQLSGVFHSLFLLIILLGASPLAKFIPMPVLAGILIKVGFDIIDYKMLKLIKVAPKNDLIVMLLVFLITVFYDLIFAVSAGIVLSSLLFAATMVRQFDVSINDLDPSEKEEDECLQCLSKYTIRIVDINGVFFFGSASRILTRVDDLLGTKYLILNCKNIVNMDISAIFALEDIIFRMQDKGINVFLVVHDRKILSKLSKLGLVKILGRRNIFYDKKEVIIKVTKMIK